MPRKGKKKKKSPARPPGLETFTDARNHRKHPEENVPSLSPAPPCFPSPSSAPYRRWIWEQRAWERSKVSRRKAQMTLSWISAKWFDSPTQSQRLKGHSHQTSKMLIQTILTREAEDIKNFSFLRYVFYEKPGIIPRHPSCAPIFIPSFETSSLRQRSVN